MGPKYISQIISKHLRTEMIIRGSRILQNESSLNAVATSTNRLMLTSWFSQRVGNEEEGTEIKLLITIS